MIIVYKRRGLALPAALLVTNLTSRAFKLILGPIQIELFRVHIIRR